jgi:type IX secretion system PorP/SprF family membrane protein
VPFEQSRLSYGISGSCDQYSLDQSVFQPVVVNDPLIDYSRISYSGFNTDIGVLYYGPDYYVGLSAVRLLSFDRFRELGLPDKPQYWLHGGYLFRNLDDIMIEPSVFINHYGTGRTFYDINVKVYHHYVNWISMSYRSYQAIRMRLAVKANQFYVTYSSEFNLSRMVRYSFGTHEIGIGINVGIRRIEGF